MQPSLLVGTIISLRNDKQVTLWRWHTQRKKLKYLFSNVVNENERKVLNVSGENKEKMAVIKKDSVRYASKM